MRINFFFLEDTHKGLEQPYGQKYKTLMHMEFTTFRFFFVSFRKKSMDPTYYTSQGIIAGGSQAFTAIEGRSTPTGLESACTVSVRNS